MQNHDENRSDVSSRDSAQQPQPFHGLIENEGRAYSNWALTRTTRPAVYVEPL